MLENYRKTLLVKYPLSTLNSIVISECQALAVLLVSEQESSGQRYLDVVSIIESFDPLRIGEEVYYDYVYFALKYACSRPSESVANALAKFLNLVTDYPAPSIYGYGSFAISESTEGSNFLRPKSNSITTSSARASLAMNLIVELSAPEPTNPVLNVVYNALRHSLDYNSDTPIRWQTL
jgi:hypothetical protein